LRPYRDDSLPRPFDIYQVRAAYLGHQPLAG
jgi:hypothetical protein